MQRPTSPSLQVRISPFAVMHLLCIILALCGHLRQYPVLPDPSPILTVVTVHAPSNSADMDNSAMDTAAQKNSPIERHGHETPCRHICIAYFVRKKISSNNFLIFLWYSSYNKGKQRENKIVSNIEDKEEKSMRKKLTGLIVGTLMLTLIGGTAAFAAETGGTSAGAAGQDKQTVAIEDAVKTALEDAKVAEGDAAVYKRLWAYSDNAEIYEIDFLIPGQVKYEYEISAKTGEILENDKENWDADDDREYKGLTAGKTPDAEKESKALAEAAETAFKDAGVTKDDVTIYKQGTDYENGKEVYVVEFLQEGKTKYEYEIATEDGSILFHEQEMWEKEDDYEYKGLLHPDTVQEEKTAESAGEISKADAKKIALEDAGLSEQDVTINKCKLDFDDGVKTYDVEFRNAEGYEYEYEIDAETGKILDKDVELDD
ncbi:MAG: hypothetical protein E7238_04165 [Sarcina sp.]|nr:hypothetical protein [Sarcina sp.]